MPPTPFAAGGPPAPPREVGEQGGLTAAALRLRARKHHVGDARLRYVATDSGFYSGKKSQNSKHSTATKLGEFAQNMYLYSTIQGELKINCRKNVKRPFRNENMIRHIYWMNYISNLSAGTYISRHELPLTYLQSGF